MSVDAPPGTRAANLARLRGALADSRVCGSVVGRDRLATFLESRSRVTVLASVDLRDLAAVVGDLSDAGKFVFLNIDSCRGLAQDKGAIEYLRTLGVPGVVSTRTALVEKAKALGQITMQKVFVTDRSNLPRSVHSTAMSKPDVLELMPWPVLPRIDRRVREELSPYVAAGFVQHRADIGEALSLGAAAVATSDPDLWDAATGEEGRNADETQVGG